MSNTLKNSLYTLILLGLILAVWWYRNSSAENLLRFEISGETMGTTYSIIYFAESDLDLKGRVDSVLTVFNQSLNTWLPDSEISSFNSGELFSFKLPYFYPVLEESQRINLISGGAFDPTVMPLVNSWGFGPEQGLVPDSAAIDSIREFTGFDKIRFDQREVIKADKRVQLDFSAIAKGYGVDVVSDLLSGLGIENSFVEIGGEVRSEGMNIDKGADWVIGITDPRSSLGQSFMFATLEVGSGSVATSGNYYNYRIRDGKRYSHTISPFTGYPIEQQILSATVVTEKCISADAIATAFMVMGHENAIELTESANEIEALIIYSGDSGEILSYISSGIRERVKLIQN